MMPAITPLPDLDAASGLVLVGGTFDPPHRAHVELAERARRAVGLSGAWLVFVPAARSPFKAGAPAPTPAPHRARMIQLAAASLRRAAVWTDEIDRAAAPRMPGSSPPAPSYWIDTLRRLQTLVPPATPLRFVIGSDQATSFHRWKDFRQILSLAEPIVLLREPHASHAEFFNAMAACGQWSPEELAAWARRAPDIGVDPVSSTGVRELLRGDVSQGRNSAAARFLDAAVLAYIQQHGLYAAGE